MSLDAPTLTLVSILVRSIDRIELLQQALDSVARQTWPAVEVVVAAAVPNHSPLPECCGSFPLRLLLTDQPLHRCQAANRALDAAQGKYLLFLDDDDGLLPEHVEKLARELDHRTDVQVAYSDVQPVNFERVAEGSPFAAPFDPVLLLAGNWRPLHAVMFRRNLIALGCRFDSDLDVYEDWDFWLQAARWTGFAHVPGISAWYRIHDSSGVHRNEPFSGPAYVKLYRKWRTLWTDPQLSAIMARIWNYYELIEHIKQLQQQVGALQQKVDDHLNSTSWRVTAPLRAISRTARSILQQGRLRKSRRGPP